MSSEASERMLGLLKEMSVYKAMDDENANRADSEAGAEAFRNRERRRQEIKLEMHELGNAE